MSRTNFVPRAARPGRGLSSPAFRLAAVGLVFGAAAAARAQVISPNTGSLGSSANATNSAAVTFGPGAVTAGGDLSAVYDGTLAASTCRRRASSSSAARRASWPTPMYSRMTRPFSRRVRV